MIFPEQDRITHITGVPVYRPWQHVLVSILRDISTNKQSDIALENRTQQYFSQNIEIELKFCVFRPRPHEEYNYNVIKNLSKKAGIHFYKEPSNFSAGFENEKQFYGMREFMFNVCKANQQDMPRGSFYRELRMIHSNGKYKYRGKQLRIDINTDKVRHTFTVGGEWTVMKKQKVNDSLDLLFCQTEFRFSFNKEQKAKYQKKTLLNLLQSHSNKLSIRIKNITKFEKTDEIEISMSEVLKMSEKKQDFVENLKSLVEESPEKTSQFIISYFANFYNETSFRTSGKQFSTQLEIESEVLHEKYESLVRQLQNNQAVLVESFFERMIQDLQSLVWADYTIMKFETAEIRNLYRAKQGREARNNGVRFQALRGDYMRNEIRGVVGAERC